MQSPSARRTLGPWGTWESARPEHERSQLQLFTSCVFVPLLPPSAPLALTQVGHVGLHSQSGVVPLAIS